MSELMWPVNVMKGGNEIDESGIVSESVSASSVILMFGGTGKFKKSPTLTTSSSNKDLLSGMWEHFEYEHCYKTFIIPYMRTFWV